MWPETHGKRGANEIATCLLRYLHSLPDDIKHVTSYSDTCSGQNRNIYVAAAMLHAVNTTHLNIIDMKFMESGHSMMEVDSMHAAIETKRKHQKLYNISHEWAMICTAARERKPHHVTELNFADFQDFHKLADRIVLNRNMSTSGQEVKWLDVKWFRFITAKPNNILVKERLTDAEFQEIEINRSVARRESTRIRQSANAIQPANAVLTPAFTQMLPISVAKKGDLVSLVESGANPPEYRQIYISRQAGNFDHRQNVCTL